MCAADGKTVVRASGSLMRDYAPLNTLIKNAPFGANYPDLDVNTSGTVQNQKTVNSYSLQAGQISWTTAGPVFPTAVSQTVNGVTYSGVTCTKTSDTVNGKANRRLTMHGDHDRPELQIPARRGMEFGCPARDRQGLGD